MADRIKIKTPENNHIHFDYHVNDYTLCGLDTCGDEYLGIGIPVKVKRKVNCPACIAIVEFCHNIKKSEFENTNS